ncbi:alpha/beta hydrolase-fold protein [Kitasatospora sp. MAP5-34]|uniref:alpha/beta hydrolase n=1 Tax=Kitasatospora sp. MAP5-34 TaxID=3035102 RepID=UPI002474112C|nr:alpha/beta hydrolase-fold protein [Kitasatospora sp. MAP5-34]MDH6577365.1 S-formylglutathione hydrolase FrmB [Kitasatospora sp. MAP5-34]
MGLTSHKVLALSIVITALTVLGTVWIWPRLAYRSWPAVFARLGTIVVTQLAVLCTIGLLVNNSFVFYSSWSDLLGTGNQGPVNLQGAVGAGPSAAPGTGPSPGTSTAKPVTPAGVQTLGTETVPGTGSAGQDPVKVGALQRVRIPGALSKLSTDGYVYLPPQYFQPAYRATKFPAIAVLTGFPGDAKNLVTKLDYPSIELQLINQGRMRPVVQILMRPSPSMPRDSECEDIPGGPQARTYFTQDVPQDVQASYRVLGGAGSWGAAGDSTGGYCALKFAMTDPTVFTTAASLSGYFKAAEDFTTGDLFGGSQQRRNEADLNWRLANLPPPPVSVMLANSKSDGTSYADSQPFAAAVHPPMTVAQATVDSGGHNFTTWVRLLPACLEWLSTHLTNPA